MARAVRRETGAARRALLDDVGSRERAVAHARDGGAGLRPRPRLSGRLSVHARRVSVDVSRTAVDDAAVRRLRHCGGDERAFPLSARARTDGIVDGVRHADVDGLRLRSRALARRGRTRRRRGRFARRYAYVVLRHPARRRVDVDDDQLAGRDVAGVLRVRRRRAGCAAREVTRDDSNGHLEGVHRAEGVHLSAGTVDATRHRHGRVHVARDAVVASDLDLGLPHPRGRFDRGARTRVYARRWIHVRRVGARARSRHRRLRAPVVVLLQRAFGLLRGDCEVPRGASHLGDVDAREVRREGSTFVADALPYTDGRRVADGAAAGGQLGAHGDRGARRSARRYTVVAHEQLRRGARPADRACRAARVAHAAGDRARDRSRQHDRSTRRLVLRRATDERARAASVRLLRPDREARRCRRGDQGELLPA